MNDLFLEDLRYLLEHCVPFHKIKLSVHLRIADDLENYYESSTFNDTFYACEVINVLDQIEGGDEYEIYEISRGFGIYGSEIGIVLQQKHSEDRVKLEYEILTGSLK